MATPGESSEAAPSGVSRVMAVITRPLTRLGSPERCRDCTEQARCAAAMAGALESDRAEKISGAVKSRGAADPSRTSPLFAAPPFYASRIVGQSYHDGATG
jgi:hypothetical protein